MSQIDDLEVESKQTFSQRFISQVRFECPSCHYLVGTDVDVPELNFSAEKSSDMTSDGHVDVECPICNEVFSGYAYSGVGHCSIELDDYPNLKISAEMPFYNQPEDWEDYELPEDPFQIFMRTVTELRSILTAHGSEDGTSVMNRMIFSQVIAALEAYLCDSLIGNVTSSKEKMAKVVTTDQILSEVKFKLAEILSGSDLVRNQIVMSLKNRLYHRIDDVSRLYKQALDVSVSPDRDSLTDLKMAIGYRHDCVHRNGIDKDGNRISVFSKEYVSGVVELAEKFANNIQNQIDKSAPF